MSRATNDLNAVRMMIGPAVMYSANTILVFVVAIVLMLSLDTRLTLMALLPLPLVSISVRYFGAAIHKRFEAIQEQLANLSAIVQEALAGVRVVRAYNQEAHEIERFRAANLEFVRRNRVLIRLQGLFFPSMTLFLGFGSLLVLWLGSRHVIRGQLTLGEFVAFNSYLVMLSWPMIAFGWVTNILQRGMASWKRMLEVLDAVPDVGDTAVTDAGRTVPLTGAIEIRDLVFTYPGTDRRVLDHVSLRIEAGQTVALVGATGSGKSTLIHLLPRLFDPPPGTVFLDGVDVLEIPLERLRGAIGFVPQEPFLFSDTIAENVSLGVPDAAVRPAKTERAIDLDRLHEAAGVARLDKDVSCVPEGLRHAGRRARHHAVRRPEAAHGHCPGRDPEPAHPDPGRCAVGGGHLHRGRDPRKAAGVHEEPDVDHRLAPGVDRAACRRHRRPSGREDRRAGHPRLAGQARRRLRRAPSPAAAAGGARRELSPAGSRHSRMSFHDEEVLGKAYDSLLMRRLLRYLRPYRRLVALALAAIISAPALQLAQPYLMKVAIDQHIATGDLAGLDRIALLFLAILLGVVHARVPADLDCCS